MLGAAAGTAAQLVPEGRQSAAHLPDDVAEGAAQGVVLPQQLQPDIGAVALRPPVHPVRGGVLSGGLLGLWLGGLFLFGLFSLFDLFSLFGLSGFFRLGGRLLLGGLPAVIGFYRGGGCLLRLFFLLFLFFRLFGLAGSKDLPTDLGCGLGGFKILHGCGGIHRLRGGFRGQIRLFFIRHRHPPSIHSEPS